MQILSNLLYTYTGHLSFLNETYKTLPTILWILLAVVGGAGTVYSIILGVNLARAESEDKRKTAATRLKNTIIGVGTLILLVLFLNVILPLILKAIWPDLVTGGGSSAGAAGGSGGAGLGGASGGAGGGVGTKD